eukprot:TRINITY_DN4729_c1_g1_i3.p1 TRINITY_DN4729_c1_g1~~TRINITY_DN4729_c1_g1_i3.p1  ORF type:complete len:509 (-),score=125.14 TRINITY_DN4729_c1_g1_i3:886-2412(-)
MSGQLGTGDVKDEQKPTLLKQITLIRALHGTQFESCDAGSDHTVFLTKSGAIYICGVDIDGQQGNGGEGTHFVPKIILSLHKEVITQVSCGGGHTLVLTETGLVYSWGRGVNGRTGHGNTDNVLKPKLIESLKNQKATSVVCGWSHSIVLTANSDVFSFGKGGDGILGHGDLFDQLYPKKISFFQFLSGGTNIREIKCGYYHSALLTYDYSVYTWGWGEFGQLGHNSKENILVPKFVKDFDDKKVKSMSLGGFHTLAVCEDGAVYACGGSQYGQLGVEDEQEMHLIPTKVDFFDKLFVIKVEAGWWHSLAICGTQGKKEKLDESNTINLIEEEFTLIEKEMEKIQNENNQSQKVSILTESPEIGKVKERKESNEIKVISDYEPNNKDVGTESPENFTIVSSEISSRREPSDISLPPTPPSTQNSLSPRSPSPRVSPFQKFSNWFNNIFNKEAKVGDTTVTENENSQHRKQLINEEKDEPLWRDKILPRWKYLAKKEQLTEFVRKGIVT